MPRRCLEVQVAAHPDDGIRAHVLSVMPLAVATCAGAKMRQPLGTAVLVGMTGATVFDLVLTPMSTW